MESIFVTKFINNALTESNGNILRNLMEDCIQTEKPMIFDFTGINLFATVCFNASVGFIVFMHGPDLFSKYIKIVNLSDPGQDAYNHSYINAVTYYKKRECEKALQDAASDELFC